MTTADRLAAAKLWLISQAASPSPNPQQSPSPTQRSLSPSKGRGTAGRAQPGGSEADAPRDLPYLAHALYALSVVETTSVAGISADQQWRLYVNPTAVAETEIPELGRELAHLTWHLLMDHAGRARTMRVDLATAEHWHHAAELTIAETLQPIDVNPLRTAADAASAIAAARPRLGSNRSAEQYYATLSGLPATTADAGPEAPTDAGCRCGSCCDGLTRTTDLPADADVAAIAQVEADTIRKQVAIDYQEHAAKGRGTTPGEALRWAREINNPTIAWEPLLARAVRRGIGWTTGRAEPTWTRPSRRQSVTPSILQPGWRRPVPHIAMVIDTSGTVDDHLLGRAMAEVDGAITALGIPGAAVTVLACDAAVGAVTRVRRAGDAVLVGGGGTDMRVGLAVASAQRPRPDLIVVLTDGYTPWPSTPPPGSAVIAAMLRRPQETLPATPSWATRIDCVLTR